MEFPFNLGTSRDLNLQQSWILHALALVLSPTQSVPLYFGSGLVHVLELFCIPSPQLAEQLDHGDHSVNPPFSRGHNV